MFHLRLLLAALLVTLSVITEPGLRVVLIVMAVGYVIKAYACRHEPLHVLRAVTSSPSAERRD